MADTLKVLGQSYPAAATLTTLYTVPSATSSTVSSVTICNQSANSDTFRLSVAVAGAADATNQYVYYNQSVPGNQTFIATIGMTLAATDLIRCYSANGTSSFNAFGVQVT